MTVLALHPNCRRNNSEICIHEWVLVVNREDPLVEISDDGEKIVYKLTETMYLKEICPRDPSLAL